MSVRTYRGYPIASEGFRSPQTGMAAWRDASWFRNPGRADRYHIVAEDGGALCSGAPLILDVACPPASVTPVLRCTRAACAKAWLLTEIVAACNSAIWWLQYGSDSPPEAPTPWLEDAPSWAVESTADSVRAVLAGVTMEQLWQRWAAAKRSAGWKYGEVKDAAAKTHPCLVDNYSQLSAREHFKDRVFLGTVQEYTRRQAARKSEAS